KKRTLVHNSQNIFPSAEDFRRPLIFFGSFFSPEKKERPSPRPPKATEGLSLRKTNFQPQRAQPFELCKKESSCTEVSLHLLEGEGDRSAVK
ncbi:MAG: hypothetical protein IIX85_03735, partial [Clostridia bacterium]|nr:hypothetical protein [Clostridia bacterium]